LLSGAGVEQPATNRSMTAIDAKPFMPDRFINQP